MAWLPVMRTERVDEIVLVDQLPEPVGAHFGQRMPDLHRAAQPLDVGRRVGALDAVETAVRRRRDEIVKISHVYLQWLMSAKGIGNDIVSDSDATLFTMRCTKSQGTRSLPGKYG